jgi:hypothetical protein
MEPDKDQTKRFVETAGQLGADEDKERFEAQLTKIAAHKPEAKAPRKKPRKSR